MIESKTGSAVESLIIRTYWLGSYGIHPIKYGICSDGMNSIVVVDPQLTSRIENGKSGPPAISIPEAPLLSDHTQSGRYGRSQ